METKCNSSPIYHAQLKLQLAPMRHMKHLEELLATSSIQSVVTVPLDNVISTFSYLLVGLEVG